jgi:GNAT superfamily N-acetyltransferase
VAVAATGAYTSSMASNYNRVPRPAAVLVGDGRSRPLMRRETLDDLVRRDVPLLAGLTDVITHPLHRGQGLARRLVSAAIATHRSARPDDRIVAVTTGVVPGGWRRRGTVVCAVA